MSETSVVAKLQALKDRIADLQSRRGKLQAEAEGAKKQLATATEAMQTKFGVSTLEEARALADEKSVALQASIEALDSQLKSHE